MSFYYINYPYSANALFNNKKILILSHKNIFKNYDHYVKYVITYNIENFELKLKKKKKKNWTRIEKELNSSLNIKATTKELELN